MIDIYSNRLGESIITNGVKWTIIEYNNYAKVKIESEHNEIRYVPYGDFKKGSILSVYSKTNQKRGYIGCFDCDSKSKSYQVWNSIMKRAYSETFHNENPTYIGCEVCEEWHNYSTFRDWFEDNYIEGYHIDKDLFGAGLKLYSPTNCIFIPIEINSFLTNKQKTNKTGYTGVTWRESHKRYFAYHCKGAYKTPEEAYNIYCKYRDNKARQLAEKYKDKLDSKVYRKLLNYKESMR